MKFLYNDEMTATEIAISNTISNNLDIAKDMSITNLANLCGVSTSKITKYSKRLGFSGYKEFQYQLKKTTKIINEHESPLDYQREKLLNFFEAYDPYKMERLKQMIHNSDKTYLFGRGPSLKVCEYYEPRLRIAAHKNIVSNYDEYLLDLDLSEHGNENKLMIVFTISGKNPVVAEVLSTAKKYNMKTVCISSYYNHRLEDLSTLYIHMLDRKEFLDKRPIRGRTLFYVYLEILTQDFIDRPFT